MNPNPETLTPNPSEAAFNMKPYQKAGLYKPYKPYKPYKTPNPRNPISPTAHNALNP